MAVSVPIDHFTAEPLPLAEARAWLMLVINHPAFPYERRYKAGQMMATTSDARQIGRWAMLALLESERWEDAVLLREEAQSGLLAFPVYPY